MPAPVALERYVGPALYVHAHGDVIAYEGSFVAGQVIPCHVHADEAIEAGQPSPPSIAELAQLAGVHPTHLLRTFRRHHGVTISNYVRHRRIQRARLEVANGNRPLSMIALDAGFADQSHFTRVFRQTFGETPGQYARSLRGH